MRKFHAKALKSKASPGVTVKFNQKTDAITHPLTVIRNEYHKLGHLSPSSYRDGEGPDEMLRGLGNTKLIAGILLMVKFHAKALKSKEASANPSKAGASEALKVITSIA